LLSIPPGIILPKRLHVTTEETMSPELVDQAILAQCRPQFYKVARVIVMVAKDIKVPHLMEGLLVDDLLTRKELKGTDVQFIADRIKALVKAKSLNRPAISIDGVSAKFV
jgi:hypothetical protein